jgi:hypothetical protein
MIIQISIGSAVASAVGIGLKIYFQPLLSKTGANLAAHAVNEDFACPKMEF